MPRDYPYPDPLVTCECCEHYEGESLSRRGRCPMAEDILRMEGYPGATVVMQGTRLCCDCENFEPTREYLEESAAQEAEARSYEDELSRARAARGFRIPDFGGGEAA